VGYVNIFFLPGDTLFGNPLENAPNQLTSLFPSAPNGATVSIWNSGSQQFSPASTYHLGSGWDVNYQIPVGAGALLHTATLFTNTFVGNVLTGPGPEEINPPTPPALGPGLYLLSSLFPANARTFHDMIGRDPVEGEFVRRLNALTQTYSLTTFHDGAWDNGTPTLDVGQAAFFELVAPLAVPEPSILTFLGVSAVAMIAIRRKRPKLHHHLRRIRLAHG
jgi:hypothetical protein